MDREAAVLHKPCGSTARLAVIGVRTLQGGRFSAETCKAAVRAVNLTTLIPVLHRDCFSDAGVSFHDLISVLGSLRRGVEMRLLLSALAWTVLGLTADINAASAQ